MIGYSYLNYSAAKYAIEMGMLTIGTALIVSGI